MPRPLSIPIFDMHADVFMDLVRRADGPGLEDRHLARMRGGGIGGAVLIDCRMAGEAARPEHLEAFIATVRLEFENCGPAVLQVRSAADLDRALRSGLFAAVVGYEGLAATGGDLSWLPRLHREAGARVAALTHNDDNPLGGGALGERGGLPPGSALGLTERGREAVSLMNELGMLIDLSHAGKATRRDILDCSARPVMLSHSSAAAIHDNGRNLSDAEMRAVADKGGLLGCMTSSAALAAAGERENHTFARYLQHLKRMMAVAGTEQVGLGLHFCEYLYTPDQYPPVSGLEDASQAYSILDALSEAGFNAETVEKVAWKNFARVFGEAVG